jgi:hypothetical protein
MFEKKPAENPFPALKKAGSTPVGPTKAEEKKVEQPPPQSVSNLKSVFEKKLATTLSEQSAPAKSPFGATVSNNVGPKKEEVKAPASGGVSFPWNKKQAEDKPV